MTNVQDHESTAVLTFEGTDFLPPELRIIAGNEVLNEHVDDLGLCAVCGSAWPCQFTELAQFGFLEQ